MFQPKKSDACCMKVLAQNLDGNQNGYLKLLPEDTEDIWQLYNFILPDDDVEALTYRCRPDKVILHSNSYQPLFA
jgi:stalled ribosome rescue protein Dom34